MQKIRWLAFELLTERLQRRKSNGPSLVSFEYRKVGDRDSYAFRKLRQSHLSVEQDMIEIN